MTNRHFCAEVTLRLPQVATILKLTVAAGAIFLAGGHSAVAQMKWDRPITIVVPFPPGGAVDIGARQIADKVRESGGPTMIVLNKPGAGGIVGALAVKQSPPDGHTLFAVDMGTIGINSAMKR